MSAWPETASQQWFAIALSDRVNSRPLACTFFDRQIVLVRLQGAGPVAFEDRCPHRQVPLSAGCVAGNSLQCAYHGWRFDANGRLVEIPGLPPSETLPHIHAITLQTREHDGIVWVRHAGRTDAPLPRIALRPSPGHTRFLWQTTWQANILDALENVLDPTHTHFVHTGLVRSEADRQPAVATCSATEDGFTVDYAGAQHQSGLIYRLFESSRDLERAHFCAPGSVQFEYGYRNGSKATISLYFTPQRHDRTQLFVAFHVEGRWSPTWAIRLAVWPFLRRVAMQDARMLALQAANRARFPDRRDALGPLDIVRRRLEAVWRPHASRGDAAAIGVEQTRMLL